MIDILSKLLQTKINLLAFILIINLQQMIHCLAIKNFNQTNTGDELLFVHLVCRHGERNIFKSYPNDPHKPKSNSDTEDYAQLTNRGKQHQYELGQYMRKRYAKLLGDGKYSTDKICIQSTDIDRAIMSAQLTLAGLFPPQDQQIWNEDLLWQPIPVHTIPSHFDYVLAKGKPCDRKDYVQMKLENSPAYTEIFEQTKPIIDAMRNFSGLPLQTLTEIKAFRNTLSIQVSKGLNFPAWIQNQILDDNSDLNRLVLEVCGFWTATDEMKKFFSGFLLKEMFDRFSSKLNSALSPNRSFWLYMAHDITIMEVLNGLGLKAHALAPFSSCLFLELHQSANNNPYVQIFYRNSTKLNEIPFQLEFPGCGLKCPLKKLHKLYAHILPAKSHDEECKLRDGEPMPRAKNKESQR